MIKIYRYGEVANSEIFARDDLSANVETVVADIIANVVKNGDKALYEYTERFDRARLTSLEVSEAEIEEAVASVPSEFLDVLREAAANIRAFHKRQVRNSFIINEGNGVITGQKITPVDRAGLYVPGGLRCSVILRFCNAWNSPRVIVLVESTLAA